MGYTAWQPKHFGMDRDELPAEAEKAVERVREVLRTERDFSRRVDAVADLLNTGSPVARKVYQAAVVAELCRRAM